MPLPDGAPTSREVLDRIYAERGPIFPRTYNQEAALRRAREDDPAHHTDTVRGALATAKAPDIAEGQSAAQDPMAGDSGGDDWPQALGPAAFSGIAGEFVRMVEPDTEADPAAILMHFLIAFGVHVGRGPHWKVEKTEHHAGLFSVLVAPTAKGRKGTARNRALEPFAALPSWKTEVSGLSSGEGLINQVRDPGEKRSRSRHGEDIVETIAGVEDKRLLVIEPEFARVLRVAQRDGNTLSATLRELWDYGRARTLTKHDPIGTSLAHIAVIGHITADELRAELTATDIANGFANRFLFVAARRSNVLPFGGALTDPAIVRGFTDRLAAFAATARSRSRIDMTPDARSIWGRVYPELSAGGDGLHGAVTARAEAQAVRLALIYALLDGAPAIDAPHLMAGLAVWTYCDATVRYIWGASLGDRVADEIMRRLRQAGDAGLTRTEIRDAFGRHQSTERIGAALELLQRKGRATCETTSTGGRPVDTWRATK